LVFLVVPVIVIPLPIMLKLNPPSVYGETSVREALDYMLNQSIRNIGINREFSYPIDGSVIGANQTKKEAKLYPIINDRNILEFLLSHNGSSVQKGNNHVRRHRVY
jgi:hypothetical protein